MAAARLNTLDELYLHLDREDEPWSVHVEIRTERHIDAVRLADAAREAARRHPIARARLGSDYTWEIADELGDVALEEVNGGELSRARERLLGHSPSLDRHGPFELLLAHESDGDVLALNLHHAAGDGLSALRLMASIARAYGREDDPLPPVDPLEVRDVLARSLTGAPAERLARGRAALDYLGRAAGPPCRIAAAAATASHGYGFELISLEPDEVERARARRVDDATVNDVLLGALAVAVRRWNAGHQGDRRAIYIMMPVNLRPPEWRLDVVGNFASYVSVRIDPGEPANLSTAVTSAAESTQRIKDGGVAGLIVELFAPPTLLPAALKQRMQNLISLTGNLLVDTAVLSNLGRIDAVAQFGDAGPVRELWFSPPGRMPLGASFGTVSLGGRLFITLRYRHALFGAAAAREFAELYRETLLSG